MKRREFFLLGAGSLAAAVILRGQARAAAETAPPVSIVPHTLRVALIQFDAVPEQIETNLQQMAMLAHKAAAAGAKWIVFHEGTVCDYTPRLDALAEPVPDGRSTRFMSGIARETGAVISFGLSERDGDRFHITQVFTGPKGFIHKYRKTWLWYMPDDKAGPWLGGYRDEWARYDPGTGPELFDIDGVKVACLICADGNSKRCLDRITALRPRVVFWPNNRSALSAPKLYANIAKQFGAALLVPNRVGKSWVRDTTGGSILCSHDGTILAMANREGREEILIYDIKVASAS